MRAWVVDPVPRTVEIQSFDSPVYVQPSESTLLKCSADQDGAKAEDMRAVAPLLAGGNPFGVNLYFVGVCETSDSHYVLMVGDRYKRSTLTCTLTYCRVQPA